MFFELFGIPNVKEFCSDSLKNIVNSLKMVSNPNYNAIVLRNLNACKL